ncbi:molybdenum cofactor biosynthesis protein MoaE [Paracoccaceae bacterium GXU_MW_L88]
MNCRCVIREAPLTLDEALAFTSDPAHGAADIFLGHVRNHHGGEAVEGITYDAHPALAEKAFTEIAEEALAKFGPLKIYIGHAMGELPIGGLSVLIAVSSAHRAESFDACRYAIEEIKHRAPIWKREHYLSGKSAWLPGHSLR